MPLLEVVGMTPTGKNFTNEQDVNAHEPKIIITNRESGLIPVINKVLSTAYHMLCRRHIDQNVLAKLTELIKYEEVASWFINGSWKKLLDEIDEQEYLRKLEVLKTKWQNICWTKRVMHFGVETTNRVESEHSVLKLWLSTCHGDLDTVFLNIYSLIQSQIVDIKGSLENSRTKEKFNVKSNPILRNISNKISHLALKKIWIEITRTNSTKRDKSYWEHMSIAHRKIQKSSASSSGSGSRSRLGLGSGSGSRERERDRHELLGVRVGVEGVAMDELQMHDGCPIPLLHVQCIHHRSDRVSNWADAYYDNIADWNVRIARNSN
ncbi:hypothetical protein M9H77_14306 [Catharanthus roseus]|uniref:Uncharacterized protein n=1 Tax=Catharanthus roseus TaxID=4058 RepID=A0ACC0BMN1_CATRO|nr:hypothetical protein M9H77_14306 [Catharanthus roseus]